LLDEDVRLEMVKMAIKDNPKLKVSNLEFSLPKPSYTIDSLHAFSSNIRKTIFHCSSVATMQKFLTSGKVFNRFSMNIRVGLSASGFNKEGIAKNYPQMKWLETPLYDISSTEIRRSIQQGKKLSNGFILLFINIL
jgi:nicotinate-nucleotide adenylyltransferase